jgi:hypothetical protein
MRFRTALLLAIVCCSQRPSEAGPLGALAASELGPSPKCRRDDVVVFTSCQLVRGDTLVTAIVDTTNTVQSITRRWRPANGPAAFSHVRDSLSRHWGAGVACEKDSDVSFGAGRAWVRPPLVTELRLGGDAGADQLALTQRIAQAPHCSGSAGAPPA